MKLIIDIPEETVDKIIKDNAMFASTISSDVLWDVNGAILNGTPIPDNVTKYMKCFECAKAILGAPIGKMCGKWKCEFERR